MAIRNGDENHHGFNDEFQATPEKLDFSESFVSAETRKPEDCPAAADELNCSDAYKKVSTAGTHTSGDKFSLTKYLSMIAVTLTSTVLIGTSALFGGISASVNSETIGIESYQCEISLENSDKDDEILAVLQDMNGETVSEIFLENQLEYELSYDELCPDTEYILTLSSAEGDKFLSHSFVTEPFVRFGELENGRIPFYLHEDVELSAGLEWGVRLYGSGGEDFSSNIYMDFDGASAIITEGLYRDKYSLVLELYINEEPDGLKTYSHSIEIGELEKPMFNLRHDAEALIFEHISGDLGLYGDFEVELYDGENFYIFYGEDVWLDGSSLTVALTQFVKSGTYTISIWGRLEGEDIYLINQIYVSEIVM